MKKGFILLLLILFSCQKDEIIIEPTPTQEMIFELSEIVVHDGQDISFEILTNEKHYLIITTKDGSVITKETFQPELGINTRKIFTSILPKETFILSLETQTEILKQTSITVE